MEQVSMSDSWPRVAVVGAGAVGGYFGGMLARAGAPVTLIGRPAHVDVWIRDGLRLESVNFDERIAVAASTDVAAAQGADLILFSVKSQHTEETGRQLARHVRDGATIVTLQNGVDNVERLRASASLDPVAAVVYVASSVPGPGHVKHGGRGDLLIGDLPGRSGPPRDAGIAQVAAWFEAAGVPCRVSPNIEVDLWTKMITNAALNPISAVVGATYGDIVAVPEPRETIRQLVNECVAVAHSSGVSLPDVDYVEMVWQFSERVGQIYASTAQDLDRGRPTEIDALNGFVVRRGAEVNVPTPVNQALLALVKLREAQVLKGKRAPAPLRQLEMLSVLPPLQKHDRG
jgi:2-dehydropantoate 2-reductase